MQEETVSELKAIIEGDTIVFENVFRKYYHLLCKYCQGIIPEPEKVEDIVQDVFVYLWNNHKTIHINTSLKNYLYTSVRHGALRELRRLNSVEKHSARLTEFIEYLQQTEYSEEEIEEIEHVKLILNKLSPRSRSIFLMSCVEEKTYKQIAVELNISVNTVKTHISNVYRIIKEKTQRRSSLILLACNLLNNISNKYLRH